mmetsp:Transcript_14433/g.40191  ORF Transcript_14433/g.40191 Transcript_14433/m.40191 type:complete len:80 (+) Transcript_14433:194-433(+)
MDEYDRASRMASPWEQVCDLLRYRASSLPNCVAFPLALQEEQSVFAQNESADSIDSVFPRSKVALRGSGAASDDSSAAW